MDKRITRKSLSLFRNLGPHICLIVLAAMCLPFFAFASGGPEGPVVLYEPYRIKRNLEYIFFENSGDYYAYLLGENLDPLAFYIAYRYFRNQPLKTSQVGDIEKMFKNNGNYVTPPDRWWDYSEDFYPKWKKERDAIMKDNFSYGGELNSIICPFGTFENALETLKSSKNVLDENELKTWIRNQDKIFDNCFENSSQWANRTWGPFYGEEKREIICDDLQLQGIQPQSAVEKHKKFNFFKWLFSLFTKKKAETPEVVAPEITTLIMPFVSSGSPELMQNEEMQNALYYYYKAKKEYLCSDIARDLFKKISETPDHPHMANATLGYVRTLSRELINNPSNAMDVVNRINEYLSRKDLAGIRDSLLFEKEKILASVFDEKEFIESQNGLENSKLSEFVHNAAIFQEQYYLLTKNYNFKLIDSSVIAKYSEYARFLYYWNFKKPDQELISRIEEEYKKSTMKNLWLVLLLRNQDLVPPKYIDIALNTGPGSKLYYPVLYYAYRNMFAMDKNRAMVLAKQRLSDTMPDITYNYFADLIMANAVNLDDAVKFMYRKPVLFAETYTLEYAYEGIKGRTVEQYNYDNAWVDEETGLRYYNKYSFIRGQNKNPADDYFLSFINFGLPIDRIYENPILRQDYRAEIFTRAFVLDRKDIYVPLLGELAQNDSLLANANNAKSDTTRDFLISYAILKNLKDGKEDAYGINIHNKNFNGYNNSDDWYSSCYESQRPCYPDVASAKALYDDERNKEMISRFLSDKEVKKNEEEQKRIYEESLVQIFAEPVLAYKEKNPKDGRSPEALSLLIKKMRRWHYRATDEDWPKQLFQTLQYKYPNSSWAKNTPVYW